jgi:hypothetical protein
LCVELYPEDATRLDQLRSRYDVEIPDRYNFLFTEVKKLERERARLDLAFQNDRDRRDELTALIVDMRAEMVNLAAERKTLPPQIEILYSTVDNRTKEETDWRVKRELQHICLEACGHCPGCRYCYDTASPTPAPTPAPLEEEEGSPLFTFLIFLVLLGIGCGPYAKARYQKYQKRRDAMQAKAIEDEEKRQELEAMQAEKKVAQEKTEEQQKARKLSDPTEKLSSESSEGQQVMDWMNWGFAGVEDPYSFGSAPQRWAIAKPIFQEPVKPSLERPIEPPSVVGAWQEEQAARAKAAVPVRPPKLNGWLEQGAVIKSATRVLKARDKEEERFQKLRALAQLAGDMLPQRPPAPGATNRALGYVEGGNRKIKGIADEKYLTDSAHRKIEEEGRRTRRIGW